MPATAVTTEPDIQALLTPEQSSALLLQFKAELVRRYAAEGRILDWGKLLMPETFPLRFCDAMHGYFVEIRDEQQTNTEAPRYHAKTTIKCCLIPLFQALNESLKYRHYLNVQATSTKAIAMNLTIRTEIENNELLRYVYGDQVAVEKWTERQFVLKSGVIFTAIGAGESIRGLNYKHIRPDYVNVDDLYDEEHIHNIEATKKLNDWFWGSLYLALAADHRSCLHLQGTAINKADLLYELASKPEWKTRTFRAINEDESLLWPEVSSAVQRARTNLPSSVFFREMQNERRDNESAIIKESWLKYYDGNLPANESVTKNRLGCDPSVGEKEQDDYTGMGNVIETRTEDGAFRYYINWVKEEHLSMDGRIRLLQNLHDRDNFDEALIEGIAGFKDFVAEAKRRTTLPVKEINHVKDKISNLESKSYHFENGRVFINKNIPKPLLEKLIEQLTNNYPAHDDIRDAVLLTIDPNKNRRLGQAKAVQALR